MRTICIVIPVYNEEENLPVLHERLVKALSDVKDLDYRILLVDDHSSDATPEVIRKLAAGDPRVETIRLSRNSGSHVACVAGIDHGDADMLMIMAADLQDPPELIPEMVRRHAEGWQIVWAVREQREGESFFTLAASQVFYWLMNRISDVKFAPKGADFLLADRRVVKAFRQMPERNISVFAAFAWLGFKQVSVPYVKKSRHAGVSKWSVAKKIKLAIDSFVGFSYLPLRFISVLGVCSATAGLLWAMEVLVSRLLGFTWTSGFASIMMAILIMGGLQLVMLGVLGEYLWRVLEESRRRPRYFVENAFSAHEHPGSERK
ncbi:MAG: glycosyltransferase family 2 protein [Verrucomicrobiae bacterium]|nr:glycosyltransferase family 2 protein [Verrucomicrobiae bacterium]